MQLIVLTYAGIEHQDTLLIKPTITTVMVYHGWHSIHAPAQDGNKSRKSGLYGMRPDFVHNKIREDV
jgi:hypothetical protein